jgi:hypothetical protein
MSIICRFKVHQKPWKFSTSNSRKI